MSAKVLAAGWTMSRYFMIVAPAFRFMVLKWGVGGLGVRYIVYRNGKGLDTCMHDGPTNQPTNQPTLPKKHTPTVQPRSDSKNKY
jgi:hypothetical protein